jgi:hypothetical protein
MSCIENMLRQAGSWHLQFMAEQATVFWGVVGRKGDVLCPVTGLAKDLGRFFVRFKKGACKDRCARTGSVPEGCLIRNTMIRVIGYQLGLFLTTDCEKDSQNSDD